MNKQYILEKSKRKDKKLAIITPTGKTINFGQKGYSDFTKHHDKNRKQRYLARSKDLNKDTPNNANFYARHILWNKPTIQQSINDVQKKYGIKIKNNI